MRPVLELTMGKIRNTIPVKLFIGMLSSEYSLFNECCDALCHVYGPLDLESELLVWENTDYYKDEMGANLRRKFIYFKTLMDPIALSGIKVFTNSIEDRLSCQRGIDKQRRINLDPGYITEAKVVLASTKDYAHRIYIGQNIYAEVTLQYRLKGKSFIAVEHTYPDFRTQDACNLFNKARNLLREGLMVAKEGGPEA